jgi:hypothetical protein
VYRLWVIGGLIGIVVFAVVGGMANSTNQDFVLYLIPVIAVWFFGILFLQGRALRRDRAEDEIPEVANRFVGWQHGFAWILGICIFVGVFAYYAGVRETLYPLGDSGPGVPIVLAPAVLAAFFGALRTLSVIRGLGGGSS